MLDVGFLDFGLVDIGLLDIGHDKVQQSNVYQSNRPTQAKMSILKKGSKRYSIFHLKCPRCQEGEMFETGSWSFKKSFDMLKRCPKCDLNYFPEPGYYYGSMFISYIWTGWFCLLFVAFFHWFLGWSQTAAFSLLGLFIVINFVYIFRISRLMWLNLHVKYDPNAIEKHEAKGGKVL